MKKSENFASKKRPSLHVVYLDDDPFQLEQFSKDLAGDRSPCEFLVEGVSNIEAFDKAVSKKPDVIVLDIHLAQEKTGIELIKGIKNECPNAVVFMRSSADDLATIGKSLEQGADDFLSKKTDKFELQLRLWNSYRLAKLKRGGDVRQQVRAVPDNTKKREVVGRVLLQIEKRVPLILRSAVSAVHIAGESGTGKEVVADLVEGHLQGQTPFLRVNCGAISPTLLESELFGHTKGAFTGATSDKKGFIEKASGGWIFLDEVATLSSHAQVALLRAIENQEIMRLGESTPVKVQVRYLSATNEDLAKLVKEGKFRKDLWQRLTETEILLPPLRERPEEIEALVKYFCRTMPGGPYEISESALEVLTKLTWETGNVRELRNCLRAMTELHGDKLLTPLSIPERIWKELDEKDKPTDKAPKKVAVGKAFEITLSVKETSALSFEALTDQLLLKLVREISKLEGKMSLRTLSKKIGISRSTLSAKLRHLVDSGVAEFNELSSMVGISGN